MPGQHPILTSHLRKLRPREMPPAGLWLSHSQSSVLFPPGGIKAVNRVAEVDAEVEKESRFF